MSTHQDDLQHIVASLDRTRAGAPAARGATAPRGARARVPGERTGAGESTAVEP